MKIWNLKCVNTFDVDETGAFNKQVGEFMDYILLIIVIV